MVFGRRKSSGKPEAAQDQPDVKPRANKLSKPYTNSLSTNSALLASQDLVGGHTSTQTGSDVSTEGFGGARGSMPTPTSLEAKREIKAQIFDGELCRDPAKPANERPRGGVAMMISKFEASNASQPLLPSPPKPKRAFSNIFGGRKPSTPATNKNEIVGSQQSDDCARPLALPSDTLVASPSFPPNRRASFQPGTATRKSIIVEVVQEESEANKPQEIDQPVTKTTTALDDDSRSFDEGDDGLWYPPPQITRTETPSSLDYTHLGGLRLGSLHIVNGRASPAASDGSRHFLAKVAAPRRDVSSDYGSESGQKDHIYPNSGAPPFARSREVIGLSSRSIWADTAVYAVAADPLPSTAAVAAAPAALQKDASVVAAEYISELPPMPYNPDRPCSVTVEHNIDTAAETASIHSTHLEPKEDNRQTGRLSSYSTLSHWSDSPISLMSDAGSVLRTTTKKTEIDDQLFDDSSSSMLGTITPDPGQTGPRTSLDSIESWHSPLKSDFGDPEAFDSAVEFQNYPPTASSSMEESMDSHVLGAVTCMKRLLLPHQHRSGKSDSGYSSGISVKSLAGENQEHQRTLAPTASRASVSRSESDPVTRLAAAATKQPQPASSSTLFKPILKSRKTAPADLPSFRDGQAIPQLARSSTEVPRTEAKNAKSKSKKLQKRSLANKKKKALVVQKVASLDFLSVPLVSPEMSAKLEVRAKELPELERTVNSLHGVPNGNSLSTVDVNNVNLRFPSPAPEPDQPVKRPGGIIAGTRHSSWFGRQKASQSKQQAEISERDTRAIISDFGTVASSIGGSPYDLARGEGQVSDLNRGKLNPSNISSKLPRPRSMFDDHTASELARLRSRTIKEADEGLRNSHKAETPRPPCHSPQPMDIPPQMHSASSFLDDTEHQSRGRRRKDKGKAPRPPSHSPRPVDISPRKASPRPALVDDEQDLDMRRNQDEAEGRRPQCHSPRLMDMSPHKRRPRPVSFNEAQDFGKQWNREEAEQDLGRQLDPDRARGPRPLPLGEVLTKTSVVQ
ncbi:hypothetical protein DV736_g73, partial [Chaetothyriales sp. CBS 134916]